MNTDYSATVIADSISIGGNRVITVEATYPRFVHSELMTHRDFSRNAASSRAIPVKKSLQRVMDTPSYPVHWGAEKPGMQSGEEFAPGDERKRIELEWWDARDDCVERALKLVEYGLHKSLVNRIIEPWSWITTIITATSWENFFAQRANTRTPLAQPELAHIADLIEAAIDESRPSLLHPGQWHLPYIDSDDIRKAMALSQDHTFGLSDDDVDTAIDILRKVSVARCARVSLLNHDGTRELPADVGLYEKLVSATPMHASPLEHVCTPDETNSMVVPVTDLRWGKGTVVGHRTVPKLGNLLGFAQLRHMVEATRS